MARALLVAVVGIWLAGVAAAAPVPAAKADESTVGKARAALDKKVTLKAEGKSLTEIVEMIRDEAKVDITLDTTTLQQFGLDVNTPVLKFEVKDVKLREAMKTALAQQNLRFGLTATGLIISTEEGLLGKQLRHRIDVDATDKPLGNLLKEIADCSGANVVFDSRGGKKLLDAAVTLKADDVPVETAVRLAAEVSGYGVVRMGNVLFVTTTERADKLAATADRPLGPTNPNPIFPTEPFQLPGGGIAPGLPQALPEPLPPAKEPPTKEEPVEKKER